MIIKNFIKYNLIKFSFFISLLFVQTIYCQNDNIPIREPVYNFLKRMQVQGVIPDFDDSILPLTRKQVVHFLLEVNNNKNLIDETDLKYLSLQIRKYDLEQPAVSLFDDFPENFFDNIISDSSKNLYRYQNSDYLLELNPIIRLKYISDRRMKNNSSLIEFGGEIFGGYKDWFGFSIIATNGIQSGNRMVALMDEAVKNSYTFNQTGRNNFDYTLGYFNIVKDPFSLELGRDRILWGDGYIDKLIISDNSQPFDFIKFRMGYKSLSYTFLHGWLVQKPYEVFINDNYGTNKFKNSKYLVISRLQFRPGDEFQASVSQLVIYADRSPELAYLNPFLFWESAQRSLNDLDNSFLSFESRVRPAKGMEFSGSIIFDDINFEHIFGGKWANINNGSGWQIGAFLTYPLVWKNVDFKLEYTQLRPFLFSHRGLPGALTYTNNGELIGSDIRPNSSRLALQSDLILTSRIRTSLGMQYNLHGDNILDENGNLIQNAGGNVFQPARVIDPKLVYFLSGNLEKQFNIYSEIEYEFLIGYSLIFYAKYSWTNQVPFGKYDDVNFWGQFRLSFN